MKEAGLSGERLTRKGQEGYSKDAPQFNRGGDIFMAEKGQEQPQQLPKAKNFLANAGKVTRAGKEWKDFYKEKGEPWESLNIDVQRGIKDLVKQGIRPPGAKDSRKEEIKTSAGESKIKIGSAIWRHGKNDDPIRIIGYAGKGVDGRDYVNIEGSKTGVPWDEVVGMGESKEKSSQSKKSVPIPSSAEEASQKYDLVADLLGKLPEPSVFQKPEVIVPGEAAPHMKEAEEIVRSKRAEANLPKGVDFYNLNPVNTAAVNDQELRLVGDRINNCIVNNTLDYYKMRELVSDLEAARKNLSAGSPDRPWAENLYNQMDQEIIAMRQAAGEVNWSAVKAELTVATQAGDLTRIEEIVKKYYDSNEHINLRDLIEVSLSNDAIASNTYGYALEYWLESIINVADLTPLGTIPNPTFVQSENISRVIMGTRDLDRDINKTFYKHLKELQERRQLSHELYKAIPTRGAYQKYVGENLKNDGFHYLENEISGVSETQSLWDKVLGRAVAKKGKMLNQRDFDTAHEKVKKLFKADAELVNGTSQKLKNKFEISIPGIAQPTIERPLREWEIDRAAVVGRALVHVSGRAISYGMLGDLSDNPDELFDSVNGEYVARTMASMKAMAKRYLGGFSGSALYINIWMKCKKIIAQENGQIYGEGDKSVYGQKTESMVLLDTGTPDIKTHGWRNVSTQLKNDKFAKVEVHGTIITIGDHLQAEWNRIKDLKGVALENEMGNSIATLGALSIEEREYLTSKKTIRIGKDDRKKRIIYSRNVAPLVMNQKLYLSALSREGNITPMLKKEIWKNVSGFLPSRIASFFPDEREALLTNAGVAMTTNHWEDLCDKLSIAEQDRVRKQAELIQANNFVTPVNLSDFYTANGIVDQMDVDYINSIIALGEAKSETLARMVFSQSAFLDDVPEVQWMNLGKETVGRLLVNDYEGHDEASTARNAIIAEPAMRLHESAEHLVKAVQGYAKPLGVPDAQERIEADAMTRYELYGMNTSSKWGFHAVNKVFRSATSPIEGVNEAANISMDEKAIFEDADYLAQHSVIGSDKGKLDFLGHTQLERIKRRAKAELLRVWLRNLRVFMMIFSGVFGTEFLKMIAPDLIRDK